jgi:WD40 repeat protein
MWLEWMLTFLKPFTREGTLSIWNDSYVEAGGLWRREIDFGLQRAAIGLLLVSPHFLASDFIMKEELPALVDAAERDLLKLVWVPISASHWRHSPLQHYQAAWNAGTPLDGLEEHQRNAALVKITEGIADVAVKYVNSVSTVVAAPRRENRRVHAADARRASRPPGPLHNVPALPPHYVPRPEDLGRLRQSLLHGGSVMVGITGEPYRVGLHGQGGIGKSVLAAALARDEQVRLAFPDGVFWVTIGEAPDVPRLQSALLTDWGAESPSMTDAQAGRKLLGIHFSECAILLVLDDVWDYRHAHAFDALGPASRLLVTTRDGAVLTALDARLEAVQRLPEASARNLLASWAGTSSDGLPRAADDVARECGYLPLALSVAGARVRDGITWEVLLKALKEGRLEFLDHPYATVFGSMRLSVDALSTDERRRYLELAVFPEDEDVPETVVLALWKQVADLDELSGSALLAKFGRKALLERLERSGRRVVALHDLQHDFLRITVRDLPELHRRLVAALEVNLPVGACGTAWWALLPEDRYPWVHLATHLVVAGRSEELRRLLFDCRWLESKLRAVGLPAVLSDFEALPRDGALLMVSGALRLSAHVLAGDPGQLRSQLTGRLLGVDLPEIQTLLRTAARNESAPWLRPVIAGLAPPAGALLRTLTGHTDWIRGVAVTPDGRRAVSASRDKTLKVWDLETGTVEHTVACHASWVWAVAVMRDGRRAISASDDGTLKVWDLETGAVQHTLLGHVQGVEAVAVTSDGRRAVSGSSDGTLMVWDLDTGKAQNTLVRHADRVRAVAVTPDGRRAVSASSDRTLKVWNLETGTAVRTLVGHAGGVQAVAVTPDGRRGVSASSDGTLKVWDLETGAAERTLTGHTLEVQAVAVTPDGRCVISASYDRNLKVWDLETGAAKRTLAGHAAGVLSVAVTPDGRHAVSASGDGTLKVWELEMGTEERSPAGHAGSILSVAVTPDGRRAVSASVDGTLKTWDLEAGVEERTLTGHAALVRSLALTSDGRRAVSASADGTLKVWSLETGKVEHTFHNWAGGRVVLVTPDGRRAVSDSHSGQLKVWDLESGTEEPTLEGQRYNVEVAAVTPDGRRAVSASYEGPLKVWTLETGELQRTLACGVGRVQAVAMMPDAQRVLAAYSNGMLKMWDLETGAEERTLAGHADGVRAVAVTPDGRRGISASSDRTLKIWNLETGAEEHTLEGHTDAVWAVAVTSDGARAISASEDGTLKVWDLVRARVISTFTADSPVVCFAVLPDGARLVAGDRLGRIHILVMDGLGLD